jgi:hypothetical protein
LDYKDHFDKIHKFLNNYLRIWQDEVLNFYPDSLNHYNENWLQEIRALSEHDQWLIDCKNDSSPLNNGALKDFINEASHLTKLSSHTYEEHKPLPDWAFKKVKSKKRHEILTLAATIEKLNIDNDFSHIVDIGGGVGHLSRVLAHYFGHNCLSLDQNKEFQEIGKKRLNKYPIPETAGNVKFVNLTFGEKKDEHDLKEVFSKDALSLGLHTCGPLAVRHIQTNLRYNTKALINFGCCYNKIESQEDVNLSQYSKKAPLFLSKYALTLATRGHNDMNYEEFKLKKRVKYYRYALHLLLYKELNQKEFLTAGESNAKLYWQDFSIYAKNKLEVLNIDHNLTDQEIQAFYNREDIQKEISTMFHANIIRWQFGRVVEHYILTDRSLFLEEQGLKVKMEEVFNDQLSPRNIGIIATKV